MAVPGWRGCYYFRFPAVSPQVIAVDELGEETDRRALQKAAACGCISWPLSMEATTQQSAWGNPACDRSLTAHNTKGKETDGMQMLGGFLITCWEL